MPASPSTLALRQQYAWRPPPALLAQARAHPFPYEPANQNLTHEQQPIGPGVKLLEQAVRSRFGDLVTHTYDRGRDVSPDHPLDLHQSGRAVDIMVTEINGRPDRRADAIANWLLANAVPLGVQYIIWSGTQWSSTNGNVSVYPGTEDHFNHLHVELTSRAAAGQLTIPSNGDWLTFGVGMLLGAGVAWMGMLMLD